MWFRCVAVIVIVTGGIRLVSDLDCAAAGARVIAVNPYAEIDWNRIRQYKLNVHTHTTESDGRLTPEQVIDEYHARGYQALAITDHDRCTWPWTVFDRDPDVLNMLAIVGNELSRHHHTLSLFTQFETQQRDHDAALAGVAEAGGIAILCHPAMHWVSQYDIPPTLRVALVPVLRRLTWGDFTIEAWFRTTNAGRNILLGNYSGSYAGALNLELHSDNSVRVYVQPSGAGKTVDINISGTTLGIDTRDGQWHHLAGVRRDGTILLYLDGWLAGRQTDHAGAFELQGDAFFIGRDTRTGSTTFEGDLSRIRLWRRGLSPDEVAASVSDAPISMDGLLAQYVVPTAVGDPGETLFADTAGHAAGPFDAEVPDDAAPQVISDAPQPLRVARGTPAALRFELSAFPTSVPQEAVEDYATFFARHPHLVAIEVLNRTRPDREISLDRELWDRLLSALMPRRPVWGVAVDDMHGMQHLGGDWIMLLTEELDETATRASLENGRYYFASTRLHGTAGNVTYTPQIESVVHEEQTGHIRITATVAGKPVPDRACMWISEGRTVHIGLTLPYRSITGIGSYVRAEITGDGGTAYTNPLGFLEQ